LFLVLGQGDHISTHALREEGDAFRAARVKRGCNISTHALREEGDGVAHSLQHVDTDFYPRPPRGGRPCTTGCCKFSSLFLPTPSARRATGVADSLQHVDSNFYPRPPRGGRRPCGRQPIRTQLSLPAPSARRATQGR